MEQLITQRLEQIEQIMREHQHWQSAPPAEEAFASTTPFCLDTLAPLEWLQWVLIPRMRGLIQQGAPLPANFAVSPYFETALETSVPGRDILLLNLSQLDRLFKGEE